MYNPIAALGNSTRVKILACLGDSPKTVSELQTVCVLSQSPVSQHLAYLRRVGLVKVTREGKTRVYAVARADIAQVCKQILKTFDK